MKAKKNGCTVAILVLVVFFLFPVDNRYSYSENYQIVTHGADMYVVVDGKETGARGPLLYAILCPPKVNHLLFHIRDQKLMFNDITWGADGCEFYAYNGKPFLDCSQLDKTKIYVAINPDVRKMTDEEASMVDKALLYSKYDDGLSPSEGWKEYLPFDLSATVPATLPEKRTVIMLGKDKYIFIYRRHLNGSASGESYSMSGPGFQQPEQLLYRWPTPAHNSFGY